MNTIRRSWSAKIKGERLVAGFLLLLTALMVLPGAAFAASNVLDPAQAYFFAVTDYNSTGLASITFSIVDINEPNPAMVAIQTPADSATVSKVALINVITPENVSVAKVIFYVNGIQSAETVTAPYAFYWDTSSLALGDYAISVKAIDTAGNAVVSDNVVVTLASPVPTAPAVTPDAPAVTPVTPVTPASDTAAPVVSISAPVNNGTLGGTVALSAGASDNVGVIKVEFYVNSNLQSTQFSAPYSFNWNTALIANGAYTIAAKAYDAAGNVGRSSDLKVTVFNDSVAPALSINQVSSPSTATSQTISGSVSDNDAVANVLVQVGSGPATAAAVSGNSWSFPLTGLPVGNSPITVRATDRAGNSSVATASIVVTEPTIAAAAPETPPALLSLIDAQLALQIASGSATPNGAQLTRLDVAPFTDGQSHPNGMVDTGDVVVILLKLVGKL